MVGLAGENARSTATKSSATRAGGGAAVSRRRQKEQSPSESLPAGPWGSLGQSPTARLTSDVLTLSTYHQTMSCSACPVECTVHGSDNERSVSLKQDGVVYIFLYVQLLLFFFSFVYLFWGVEHFLCHSWAIAMPFVWFIL